ncbi:hypothetical protein RhiTH_011633 [Rhizoctonia solani]
MHTDQVLLDSFDFNSPKRHYPSCAFNPRLPESGSSGTLLSFAESVAHDSKDPEHWDWRSTTTSIANKTTEVPLGTGGEERSGNMESEGQRSEDERSDGGESICLAQDDISDEEEPSMDDGATEYGDNVSEDEMEGYAIDENEDVLYGF